MAGRRKNYNRDAGHRNLLRKAALLRLYLVRGVPAEAFVPASLRQFAQWTDASLRLRACSYSTVSPENRHNVLIVAKAKAYWTAVLRQRAVVPDGLAALRLENERLKDENSQLRTMNAYLARGWHEARHEANDSRTSLNREMQRTRDLDSVISQLRAQLIAHERRGLSVINPGSDPDPPARKVWSGIVRKKQ
ncbi:hypothetical protein MicloDRAFT_00046110 [Microvirga lotononidis]|uniref:Uncharacterized protein n=1 Tax=Microvirga lotononidis TaxID=864069 RepID=I4YVP2_9HYPH|nr:hypothetical protein MicloDRAFT_00046110 [Microvirga lotononidis]